MVKKVKKELDLGNVTTTYGICPQCNENAVFISIVTDYYKCSACGEETKQYVNGSIKYLRITNKDREWLKDQRTE